MKEKVYMCKKTYADEEEYENAFYDFCECGFNIVCYTDCSEKASMLQGLLQLAGRHSDDGFSSDLIGE